MVAALLVSDRPLVSGVRGAGRAPSGSCSVRSPRRHLRPVELACLVLAVVLLGLKAADLYQRLVRVLRQAAATPVLDLGDSAELAPVVALGELHIRDVCRGPVYVGSSPRPILFLFQTGVPRYCFQQYFLLDPFHLQHFALKLKLEITFKLNLKLKLKIKT